MAPLSAFLIGVAQDMLSGSPAGLWALVYLLAYAVTASLRIFFVGRSAGAAWPGFLIVVGISGLAIWILASLFYLRIVHFPPVVAQMAITAALYPSMAWVFTFFLPQAED